MEAMMDVFEEVLYKMDITDSGTNREKSKAVAASNRNQYQKNVSGE
jgi:hypothetical protein